MLHAKPEISRTKDIQRTASLKRAPLALALGRLHPNKGFDLLLEALAATREVTLWIAGDGPLRSRLERLATRLGIIGRVRFLGWRGFDRPRLADRQRLYAGRIERTQDYVVSVIPGAERAAFDLRISLK